jgi:serine/threonine protein kinase
MFSENYSVCLNDDGSPREIERNGSVVTYKATGYETGRMIAMQLIPVASIDEVERVRFEESARMAQKVDHVNLVKVFDVGIKDDHLVFVSEYLEGETADVWIDEHGPMPADAVLRIGLQIMDALAAAATHSLTHRSIQPANVIILPGVAADGGWPRIKIRNFGLPNSKFQSDENETRQLVPAMPREFSSPEQAENRPADFRADIFSLGATMWFLLTGSAPSTLPTTESGPRLSAPAGTVPRFVRNLVSRMLRTNPEERPQDPVAFAEKIHACLQKAERRTAFTRSFAPAAIPTIPIREKKRIAPAFALAASIALLGALGAFYFVRSQRESKPLGVIIGMPETAELSPASVSGSPSAQPSPVIKQAAEQSGLVAQQSPTQTASPSATAVMANNVSSSPQLAANNRVAEPPAVNQNAEQLRSVAQQSTAQTASPAATSVIADKPSPSPQLAANNRMAEPPVPAQGPSETSQAPISAESPPPEKSESPGDLPDRTAMAAKDSVPATKAGNEPSNASEHVAPTRKRNDFSSSKMKSRRQRLAKSARPLPPLRVGSESARVVGTTSNGNWVLRLPSGETIVTPPVPNIDDAPVISHRPVRRVPRAIPLEDEPPVIVLPPDF